MQKGLFELSLKDILLQVSLIVVGIATAVFLRDDFPFYSFFLATVMCITLVWWIHDAGHGAFFSERKTSHLFMESLGLLFLGMPQIEYHHDVHRIHHAYTNIIGKDGALATKPVNWHYKQLTLNENFNKFQSLIWFGLVLPLVWPLIGSRCVMVLWKQKHYLRLSLLILRWALVLWFFRHDLSFIFGPPLIAGFVMGFASSLNHFHMPMDDKKLDIFPRSVFLTTQNLNNRNEFATWLMGGLNFHIEHHLFPTMPSRNLKYAAPLVEKFARQNELPYELCPALTAIQQLNNRLQNPTAEMKLTGLKAQA
ncbi:MAG: acyl-CoA desaturase [Pseudobdellovibrio sp.]